VEKAVNIALKTVSAGGTVLAAGSLFLVGELKKLFPDT